MMATMIMTTMRMEVMELKFKLETQTVDMRKCNRL
jgi:hypothetical protein